MVDAKFIITFLLALTAQTQSKPHQFLPVQYQHTPSASCDCHPLPSQVTRSTTCAPTTTNPAPSCVTPTPTPECTQVISTNPEIRVTPTPTQDVSNITEICVTPAPNPECTQFVPEVIKPSCSSPREQKCPVTTTPVTVRQPPITTPSVSSDCINSEIRVTPPPTTECKKLEPEVQNPSDSCAQRQECPVNTTTVTVRQPPITTPSISSDCKNGEIYPSATGNCDQFLMCYNRILVLMICPPGLAFNSNTKSCDRSENVPSCSARAY